MRFIMYLGAIVALLVGLFGFASIKSDIQVIIGLVGFFSFLILMGIGSVMGRLDRT